MLGKFYNKILILQLLTGLVWPVSNFIIKNFFGEVSQVHYFNLKIASDFYASFGGLSLLILPSMCLKNGVGLDDAESRGVLIFGLFLNIIFLSVSCIVGLVTEPWVLCLHSSAQIVIQFIAGNFLARESGFIIHLLLLGAPTLLTSVAFLIFRDSSAFLFSGLIILVTGFYYLGFFKSRKIVLAKIGVLKYSLPHWLNTLSNALFLFFIIRLFSNNLNAGDMSKLSIYIIILQVLIFPINALSPLIFSKSDLTSNTLNIPILGLIVIFISSFLNSTSLLVVVAAVLMTVGKYDFSKLAGNFEVFRNYSFFRIGVTSLFILLAYFNSYNMSEEISYFQLIIHLEIVTRLFFSFNNRFKLTSFN
jgi:hypothetical protein